MNTGIPGKNLIIRADASIEIGTGHLMRCLALAQAWQDAGGHAVFVRTMESPVQEARLESEGMEVVHLTAESGSADDGSQTATFARKMGASWVVVDGYHFGADYQQIIKDSDLYLLFIDDIGHADHYHADIVLNQNIHANEGLYVNRESYTRLLLGTRYVLLRRGFFEWRGWKREIPEVACKVLVTLGGSDPDNVTLKVINALKKTCISDLDVRIVVGPSNPNTETLQDALLCACPVESQEAIHTGAPCSMRILQNVMDMADPMAWADIAISAGGITSWELAFMGVPSLVMSMAENQRSVAEQLHGLRAAVYLGWYENLSIIEMMQELNKLRTKPEVRREMARSGQGIVDGAGANRILMHLFRKMIRLRPVQEEDCRLIWEWANDPDVRAVSFTSEPIAWDNHVKWFRSRLNDPSCIFYISNTSEGVPIGQIRFDLEGEEGVVSISIDSNHRGDGYGSAMISLASEKVFEVSNISVIHAYVKKGNDFSVRAFEKAGFKIEGIEEIYGTEAIRLILRNRLRDELPH